MEEVRATIANKHGRKRNHPLSSLSIGGEGGIAGLVVFGGALAVAGFMAVASLASNKNKAKGNRDHQPKPKQLLLNENGCKSEEDHEITQSLSSFLQHSTTQDGDATCCWTSNMSNNQVSSSELLSSKALILEEKNDLKPNSEGESPTCFYHQEIAFSDCSHPESVESSNENGVAEESLASLFNKSSSQAQEVEKDEPQDDLRSTETETGDDDTEEEDDDVDMKSDDVSETDEEDSSKATGTTSLDYNEDPVLPAELIQEFKGDYCDSHVCSDSDAGGSDYAVNDEAMTVAKEATFYENANFSLLQNVKSSVMRTRVIPMLLLALLLLLILLTRRPQESFQVLDDGNSVIVP